MSNGHIIKKSVRQVINSIKNKMKLITIKKDLQKAYDKDKLELFEVTFNCESIFYEEPQNFNDYLDLIEDFSNKKLLNIINQFNQN
jgi:hypothetical protein